MSNTVLIKPLFTEKSMKKETTYLFQVEKSATKATIKKAIETAYKVEVSHIQTTLLKGKKKNVGRKRMAKIYPSKKKAYITLSKGEIADVKVK